MLKDKSKIKQEVITAKSREDILAEANVLKVLVWKLWEDSQGSISNEDWNELKEYILKIMRNIK